PDDSTPEQRARFEAGAGGALAPLMSVDKAPEELGTFAELAAEARQFGPAWAVVFVASLSGRDGRAPTSKDAEQSLQRMIESIKSGAIGAFIPFDRQGEPLLLG
ncbi:MAG: ribonucleotide reductase subunit alpha, partial [Burkholderiales bacterium]